MIGQNMTLSGRAMERVRFTIRKADNGFIVEGYKDSFGEFCFVFTRLEDAQEFIGKNIKE